MEWADSDGKGEGGPDAARPRTQRRSGDEGVSKREVGGDTGSTIPGQETRCELGGGSGDGKEEQPAARTMREAGKDESEEVDGQPQGRAAGSEGESGVSSSPGGEDTSCCGSGWESWRKKYRKTATAERSTSWRILG